MKEGKRVSSPVLHPSSGSGITYFRVVLPCGEQRVGKTSYTFRFLKQFQRSRVSSIKFRIPVPVPSVKLGVFKKKGRE